MKLPKKGIPASELLDELTSRKIEDVKWQEGRAMCLVYHPGEERAKTIRDAYNLFYSENALNPSAFPSLRKLEAEVISICVDLLRGTGEETGSLTSGGTESILMAVKAAREYARLHKPEITAPEVLLPESVHPAFHKACHYFGLKAIDIPLDAQYRADMTAMKAAVGPNTIMMVGSSPCYPYGVVDPLAEMSDLALKKDIWLHSDACVGGFFLPFLRKIGHPVYDFDFFLDGVKSISADLHKYGYAAKGASAILYKNAELRKHQFFVHTNWKGGLYGSPTIAGTRPGGPIAAAWTALNVIGEEGYVDLTRRTMQTTRKIKEAVIRNESLKMIGQPEMSLLAIGSDQVDIYEVADLLQKKGWFFDRQQNPPCIHLTISQVHSKHADDFIFDLEESVELVKKFKMRKITDSVKIFMVKGLSGILPKGTFARLQSMTGGKFSGTGRTAPMYGMMGALAGSGDIEKILLNFMDQLNSLE